MHVHCDICVMKLCVLQCIVWGVFPFLRQFWPTHFDLPAKVLKALTHIYFTIIWLIPLKSWGLPVSVEQSMGIGRRSNYLWEYWQEFCTTGRRCQGFGEGGQTLEQGVKRDSGILIPGNSQPLGQPAVAAPALKGQSLEMPIQQWWDMWVL